MLRNTRSRTVFSFQHHSLCEEGQNKQSPPTIVKKKSLSKLTSAAETLSSPWSQVQLSARVVNASQQQVSRKPDALQRSASEAAPLSGRSKVSGEGGTSVPMSPAGLRGKPPAAPPALPSFPSTWKTNANELLRPVKADHASVDVNSGSATWPSASWKSSLDVGSPSSDQENPQESPFAMSSSLDAALRKTGSCNVEEVEDSPIRIDAKAPPMLSRSKAVPWSLRDDADDSAELKKPSWFSANTDPDVALASGAVFIANGTATSSETTSPAPRRSSEDSVLCPSLSPCSFSLPEKTSTSGRSPKRRPEILLDCVVNTPDIGGAAPTPSAGSQQSPRSVPAQSPMTKTDGIILSRASPRAAKVLSSPSAALQHFSPQISHGQSPCHGQTRLLHSQGTSASNERSPPMFVPVCGQHYSSPGTSMRISSKCSALSYEGSSAAYVGSAWQSPSHLLSSSPNAAKAGQVLFQTTTSPKFSLVQQTQASVHAGFQKTQMASSGTQGRLFTLRTAEAPACSEDASRKLS